MAEMREYCLLIILHSQKKYGKIALTDQWTVFPRLCCQSNIH